MIWLAAFILGTLGILLLLLGLRGRQIDNHPFCRWCRFDLVGLYPAAAACPECGADLRAARTVLVGRRKLHRPAAGLGAVVLALAAGLGGLLIWGSATGSNWHSIKPTWLLVWEVRLGATPNFPVLDELHTRAKVGALSEQHLVALARHAARRLQSPRWSWHLLQETAFIDAWERGLVDDAAALRYAQRLDPPVVNLEAGPDGDWPHMLTVAAAYTESGRAPPSQVLTANYTLIAVEFANGPGEYGQHTIAAEYNTQGVVNWVYGQVVGPMRPRGPLVTTWRGQAVSRAGARAGETMGEWTFSIQTNIDDVIPPKPDGPPRTASPR